VPGCRARGRCGTPRAAAAGSGPGRPWRYPAAAGSSCHKFWIEDCGWRRLTLSGTWGWLFLQSRTGCAALSWVSEWNSESVPEMEGLYNYAPGCHFCCCCCWSKLRSCVKVEVAVLGFRSLTISMVSVAVKQQWTLNSLFEDVPLVEFNVPWIYSHARWELSNVTQVFVVVFVWRLSGTN